MNSWPQKRSRRRDFLSHEASQGNEAGLGKILGLSLAAETVARFTT